MRDASAAAATEIAADDSAGIKAAPKYYVDAVNVIMKLYSWDRNRRSEKAVVVVFLMARALRQCCEIC